MHSRSVYPSQRQAQGGATSKRELFRKAYQLTGAKSGRLVRFLGQQTQVTPSVQESARKIPKLPGTVVKCPHCNTVDRREVGEDITVCRYCHKTMPSSSIMG